MVSKQFVQFTLWPLEWIKPTVYDIYSFSGLEGGLGSTSFVYIILWLRRSLNLERLTDIAYVLYIGQFNCLRSDRCLVLTGFPLFNVYRVWKRQPSSWGRTYSLHLIQFVIYTQIYEQHMVNLNQFRLWIFYLTFLFFSPLSCNSFNLN